MVIADSDLLFWATLYMQLSRKIRHERPTVLFHRTSHFHRRHLE